MTHEALQILKRLGEGTCRTAWKMWHADGAYPSQIETALRLTQPEALAARVAGKELWELEGKPNL